MAETSHNILLLDSIVNSTYMFLLTFENAITSVAIHHSNITCPAVLVHSTVYASPIHPFNKSGRHLEFSMNDVIRGKIIHVAKMATKDEISVDVDFSVCSYKKECFYFISRGIFFLQCLYGYVILTLKLSCKDIPGSMTSRTNES